ncbi:MAG: aspartate--ammonia ligase [Fusobacteria bacterium]|nr:aspartate--ammonia ligase [Fusobacteriota bacterium]
MRIYPENYKSALTLIETERAIKKVKDYFEKSLSYELNLTRVSAPLFVRTDTGLNDNLNGVEGPVSFKTPEDSSEIQIVHSLAKWKRMALHTYGFKVGEGIYTDMNAIRKDEETGNMHSIYVDQWDWEKIITKETRTEEKLKNLVTRIYNAFKSTAAYISYEYPVFTFALPDQIYFVTTQELEDKYPELSPKERENIVAKEHKAVFIMKVGGKLKSGEMHDGRAPDYDDWELNGDIVLYNEILGCGFEVSSMGIRVDKEALLKQVKERGCEERLEMPFHKMLLSEELPFTAGGGIGQSRICMYFLKKAHIGEVQSSIWPAVVEDACNKAGIQLL